MVMLLILAILIVVSALGYLALVWANAFVGSENPYVAGRPEPRSLFDLPQAESTDLDPDRSPRAPMLERAKSGDLTALDEAERTSDPALYAEVLDRLIDVTNDSGKLGALAAYISSSTRLRANPRLAERVINEFNSAPSVRAATEMLHIASRADDAATYHKAADACIDAWGAGSLSRISAADLRQLIESQFWELAQHARRGGQGFQLKRRLAAIRHELAGAKLPTDMTNSRKPAEWNTK